MQLTESHLRQNDITALVLWYGVSIAYIFRGSLIQYQLHYHTIIPCGRKEALLPGLHQQLVCTPPIMDFAWQYGWMKSSVYFWFYIPTYNRHIYRYSSACNIFCWTYSKEQKVGTRKHHCLIQTKVFLPRLQYSYLLPWFGGCCLY